MNSLAAIGDLDAFVSTREALHQMAEHVVARARYVEDGRVELEPYAGGFATPLLPSGRRVRVDGLDIVVDDSFGSRSSLVTTVADAASFVGVTAGFPSELYAPATPLQPDVALRVDRASADVFVAWLTFAADVFEQFAVEIADAAPSPRVLWPEHFDLACFTNDADESRRANYGASPGDAGHPEPYLYVGPWTQVPKHEFWNAPHFNGAVLPLSHLVVFDDPHEVALQFLKSGRARLVGN